MMQQPQGGGKATTPQASQGKASASPQMGALLPVIVQLLTKSGGGNPAGKGGTPQGPPQGQAGPSAGSPTTQGHMGAVMGPMSNPNMSAPGASMGIK